MANLKQIRKHIISVQNTGKITKAMKMVAVSKLRKSQAAVTATRPYVSEIINVIQHLLVKAEGADHPLLRVPQGDRKCLIIAVSGDKGLCGAYNHNIVKRLNRFVEDKKDKYSQIKVLYIGVKAYEATRRMEGVEREWLEDAWDRPSAQVAQELSEKLCEDFIDEVYDDVFVLYTKFKSAITQTVVLDGLLPLRSILKNKTDKDAEEKRVQDIRELSFLYEPSSRKILDVLLPRAVTIHIHRALLEGLASENGSRMTAMDNASKNAEEMIEALTLNYNRARQSAITTELIEVVSGAEAL